MDEKTIPWHPDDVGYKEFWNEERRKVERGINIDGWQMSGWLYWHLNHWKIEGSKLSDWGEPVPITITPTFRDNELKFNDILLEAERTRKGIGIMGLRQFSKTTVQSSYAGRSGILFKGGQNLLMGTSKDDLNNLTASLDYGLLNCSKPFRIPRITRDWSDERVLLGVKRKNNDNDVYSQYVIRNTSGGKSTEKAAGVSRLKCNIWDEIGKAEFLSAFIGSKPAMLNEFGWTCIPMLMGTGGNVENAFDAKQLFFNPDAHNLISEVQEDGRVTGIFLSGEYRSDCKYITTLAQHLLDTSVLLEIPKDSELWITTIKISDKVLARETIKKELDAFLNSNDTAMYHKWKMYYPLTVDDVFLSDSNNNFPVDAIKGHKNELEKHYEPLCVQLYRDENNKVEYKESNLKPILKFPVGPKDIKEAPVVIYEHPIEGLPFGTYVVGIDPYNENESSDKINSLGSIYVFKRMYTPLGEYQNSVVCSFTGRCKEVKDFHRLCVDVCEYYNALGLPENEDKTLIQYFYLKNKDHLLLESQELAKQINPLTFAKRNKGLAATTVNQKYYMNIMVEYTKEEIYMYDKDGEEVIKMGCCRIPDVMLLEEMIEYKGKSSSNKGVHDGNYDRIIGFGHCLTAARYLDIATPLTNFDVASIGKSETYIPKRHITTPFIGMESQKINNPFSENKRKYNNSPFTGIK
jgi:hypothetical protein